jgi:hypothetical protein
LDTCSSALSHQHISTHEPAIQFCPDFKFMVYTMTGGVHVPLCHIHVHVHFTCAYKAEAYLLHTCVSKVKEYYYTDKDNYVTSL